MKKILIIAFLLLFMGITNVMAETAPTLNQIVERFNNSKTVKGFEEGGTKYEASISNNNIIVKVTSTNESKTVEFIVNNNIISTTINNDDFIGMFAIMIITDAIGTLHGYEEGAVNDTLNSEEFIDYRLETEGIELIPNENEKLDFKIDISKKIPLVDVTNVYIGVEDLDDLKEFISGNGSAESSKGNVWFNKSGYNGDNTVLIAEKNNLTQNAYLSLISIIDVMFDSTKVLNYFKENYSSLNGNKEFTGFKIELNPVKNQRENSLIPDDEGYEFMRVTIDKNAVNELVSNNEQTQNPDTGTSEGILSLAIILIVSNVLLFYTKRKNKFLKI